MPIDAYYQSSASRFLRDDSNQILGTLAAHHHHALEELQRWAWLEQIEILRHCFLEWRDGYIFFEVHIPRMGKRADCVLIMRGIVFVLEFKTGSTTDSSGASLQVHDYALDLKNFHEGSHCLPIIPVVILPAFSGSTTHPVVFAPDGVAAPIIVNEQGPVSVVQGACTASEFPEIDVEKWVSAGYRPTPTIIEAAFRGTRWQRVANPVRQNYLRNAYRVNLTRARQGMVLFVPRGSATDPTRTSSLYDGTFQYLMQCGFEAIES